MECQQTLIGAFLIDKVKESKGILKSLGGEFYLLILLTLF